MNAIDELNAAHDDYLKAAAKILSMDIDITVRARFAAMEDTIFSCMKQVRDYLDVSVDKMKF